MPNYVVTGNLGGGKSLVCVGKIRDALQEGRVVATNLDLNIQNMFHRRTTKTYMRLPDQPTIDDLNAIGIGNHSYDESRNGILALDECGTWFNARNWQDAGRKEINDWFLHMRKRGWDLYLIIQHIDNLDAQARKNLAEMTVFCRRLDRMKVPFIGGFIQLITGIRLSMPRVHSARVVYGTSPTDLKIDRWVYRGTDLYNCYDTKQIFNSSYPNACHSVLSPYHINRNSLCVRDRRYFMRLTKLYWKRFKSPLALAVGILLGVSFAVANGFKQKYESIQPLPVESQPVDLDSSDQQDKDPYIDKIHQMVSKLHILGYTDINDGVAYELGTLEDVESTRYTSMDLASMGLIIRNKSECHLDVVVGDRVVPILCPL